MGGMDARIATGETEGVSLLQHIFALSEDTRPQTFPPAKPDEPLEGVMKRRAEAFFRHAICRRIFWSLEPTERAAVRAHVMEKEPIYRVCVASDLFDVECYREVERLLDRAQTQFLGSTASSPTPHPDR